jgi:zona occludens toxin
MSAPVTLVTGLPGNGKTLYTICMVKEWAEKENRKVYFNGIEILDSAALPWEPVDAIGWFKVPPGSIIVIDEAHKTFPVRANGSVVPPHVLPIAELRHEGHNLVLITQHPMEIDSAVRRRVGRHLHCVRRFGMQACAIREWPRVVENCDKTDKGAIAHEWIYNKAAYAWYKSAEVHTIKRKLPARLLWLVAALLLVPFSIWYMIGFFNHYHSGDNVKAASSRAGASSEPLSSGAQNQPSSGVQPLTPGQYARQFEPRIPGLAYTAPIYDKVTAPVRAPYPAACLATKTRCQCYTQQGTSLEVQFSLCRAIAAGGFFVAWNDQAAQLPLSIPQMQQLQPKSIDQSSFTGAYDLTPGFAGKGTQSDVRQVQPQADTDGAALKAVHVVRR